jgi:hypothetical protein
MSKWRKKPVVIEAVQYKGHNRDEINAFVGADLKTELESETAYIAGKGAPIFSLTIPTLEGDHKAMPGDWIIKGIKGEFYPCKPDIFEKTYEAVEEFDGMAVSNGTPVEADEELVAVGKVVITEDDME